MRTLRWTLLLLLSALWGCSSPPHRTIGGPSCELPGASQRPEGVWETAEGACRQHWAVHAPTHGVSYVEIDPQGVLHNRQAVEEALAFASAPTPGNRPAYVVVFIHGWHHDASPDDENVQAFHSALAALKSWHPDDEIRGIYVGWRGASVKVPVLRYLSFWDRKNTSDEVGRGGLLEFLLRLEREVKSKAHPDNRLVLVGHSFGASVAFNALAHVYMERFVDGIYSNSETSRFRGYGDLVVLINPAIEAMRYMPLHSALAYYSRPSQMPRVDFSHEDNLRLVILSSQGDWATHYAFPTARLVSTVLEEHQSVTSNLSPAEDGTSQASFSEWWMDRYTVANFTQFQSHWPAHLAPKVAAAAGPAQTMSMDKPPPPRCRVPSRREMWRLLSQTYEQEPGPSDTPEAFEDSQIRIARRPLTLERSPYLIADVGTEIIADHTSIDSLNLICWINQLVDAN